MENTKDRTLLINLFLKNESIISNDLKRFKKDDKAYSKKNVNDIAEVIENFAYMDTTRRTTSDLSGLREKLKNGKFFDKMAKKISEYLNESTDIDNGKGKYEHFDRWHNSMCNWIIAETDNAGNKFSYGKAQKLLNMSLKYIYCFNDFDNDSTSVSAWHVALDSIMLKWFGNNVEISKERKDLINTILDSYDAEDSEKEKCQKCFSSKTEFNKLTWSSKMEYCHYIVIQNLIRDYHSNNSDTPYPFLLEFIVWPKQQIIDMHNETIKNIKKLKNYEYSLPKAKKLNGSGQSKEDEIKVQINKLLEELQNTTEEIEDLLKSTVSN